MTPRVITRGSPLHRAWQVVGWTIFALGVAWVAWIAPDYLVVKFSVFVTFAVAILGLNLITGYSGQVSLGHSAFFGIGAYTTAILMADHGWSFWWTLPAAALTGFVVGFVVGLPALRIRGLYLALVTLAIAVVFPVIAKKFDNLTGGSNGKTVSFSWDAPSWFPISTTSNAWIFLTVTAVALVLFGLTSNLVRSRVGRGLQALRDNEIGAAVSGVHPAAFKTMAFAVGSSIGALGGALYTLAVGTVSPDSFGLQRSIEFIAGLVVGGVGTITGAWVGGYLIEFLPYYSGTWLEGPRANILLGAILIAIVFVAPGGIMWLVRLVRSKFVVFVPRLPQISPAPVAEEPVLAASAGAPDTATQGGQA